MIAVAFPRQVRPQPARRLIHGWLTDRLGALGALDTRDLQGTHAPASIACGTAGIAYALWHARRVLPRAAWVPQALRWTRRTQRALRSPDGLAIYEHGRRYVAPEYSVMLGRAGAHLVAALVASAVGERESSRREILCYCRLADEAVEGAGELFGGAAGYLCGLAALLRHTRNPNVVCTGRYVADRLWSRFGRGRVGWARLGACGVAHGAGGVHLALLRWWLASATPIPDRFARSITLLLGNALRDPAAAVSNPGLRKSWCNGLSGLAMLAARGYEALGDPALLEASATAIRMCLGGRFVPPNLCCGRGGLAYACLALARSDRTGPWRALAWTLALSIIATNLDGWTGDGPVDAEAQNPGLLRGSAGYLCLMADLLGARHAGFPVIEAA